MGVPVALRVEQSNLFEAEEIIKLEKILPIQMCRRNMKLIKLCPTIVVLVNFIDAAPLELAFKQVEAGPVKRKCREISWIDNSGQVTQHKDCGLKFSYTINGGAPTTGVPTPPTTTSTTTTTTTVTTSTTTIITTTLATISTTGECGLNETPGTQDAEGMCPGDQFPCPDRLTCVLSCHRCDAVSQCPKGEDFDGGEEDEGEFCESSGSGESGEDSEEGSGEGLEVDLLDLRSEV